MLSQLQVKVVVKQVSNSPLKKKIQIFKTVSILLFFHHIESNFVSLVLFYYVRKDMGIAYLLKMGLVLKSEVRFCTISQPSEK